MFCLGFPPYARYGARLGRALCRPAHRSAGGAKVGIVPDNVKELGVFRLKAEATSATPVASGLSRKDN
jgi:hypothetical protein